MFSFEHIMNRIFAQLRALDKKLLLSATMAFALGAIMLGNTHIDATSLTSGHLITVHDGNQTVKTVSYAPDVKEALKSTDISPESEDVVEPSLDSAITSDTVINIYKSRPVLVVDGDIKIRIITASQTITDILDDAGLAGIKRGDKVIESPSGDFVSSGVFRIYTIKRSKPIKTEAQVAAERLAAALKPTPQSLTLSKGAQYWSDSKGVSHRETYYDLPMGVVMGACGNGDKYTVRSDGAKIDQDGYVLVAANYAIYPRCSVVETSMGLGKVYDTGGFVSHHPYGFDLATDWSYRDGI